MYWKETWRFPGSIEYEYKYAGNYGAKGEKRQKKKKATPEQIKKQNQLNREKKMRRLIKANFSEGDLWTTLKYPKGTRKELSEVKKDIKIFIRQLRAAHRKFDVELKFIYRLEIGRCGGIHFHILTNRIRGETSSDILIQRLWTHGRASHTSIYEYGGFKDLAEYIVKQPDSAIDEQLSMFDVNERKEFIKYSSSRNLVRPEPEKKKRTHMTMRKLVEQCNRGDGPVPTPGFYIDRDSVHIGVNRFTGMSYLRYTEYRIKAPGKDGRYG